MKTLKAVPINKENFSEFGSIANIADPEGNYGLGEFPSVFHRDIALMPIRDCTPVAFGSLKVGKRDFIIRDVEYHSHGCEVMMPLDDDMLIYAGPASADVIELDKLQAFLVPKGCLIVFRPGAWHGAPYPIHGDGTVLICLPERTYWNDTQKYELEESDFLAIELS